MSPALKLFEAVELGLAHAGDADLIRLAFTQQVGEGAQRHRARRAVIRDLGDPDHVLARVPVAIDLGLTDEFVCSERGRRALAALVAQAERRALITVAV